MFTACHMYIELMIEVSCRLSGFMGVAETLDARTSSQFGPVCAVLLLSLGFLETSVDLLLNKWIKLHALILSWSLITNCSWALRTRNWTMPSIGPPAALKNALAESVTTGSFIDTKFYVFLRRSSEGNIDKPRAVYANSFILTQQSEYFSSSEFTETTTILC